MEDPTAPGVYESFTCNTEFDRDRGYASTRLIKNYRGQQSLKNGVDENYKKKWNAIAKDEEVEGEMARWSLVEGDERSDFESSCPSRRECF